MDLESLVTAARDAGASDLHLEPGLPPCVRVRGRLQSMGPPAAPGDLLEAARALVGEDRWPGFLERRSCDVARTLSGEYQLGVLVNPTPMWQVQAVAESGETMPPKSTFFYPKLASGLVMRRIHEDLAP